MDHWIETPRGRLFARSWTPAGARGHAPIILFHDSLGCVTLWRDFPGELAAATGRQVIAYDRLGFGLSDPFAGEWSNQFIHDEARDNFPLVLAAFGITRFVAFGYSVGGPIAANCAALYPATCEALITMSAQACVDEGILAGLRQARGEFQAPGQLERLARYHGDKAAWVLEAWLGTWLHPSFAGWHIEQTASGLICPLLAIHGDRDEYGSLDHPRRIAALTSGPSEVVILTDCSHHPLRDQPSTVLDVAAGFLHAVPPLNV